jgi:HAD superfamily hydrolase (TIGR01509 family)
MDGTLIDSTQAWIDADIEFGEQNGFRYTEEMYNTVKTMRFYDACRYLCEFCDLTIEQAAEQYFLLLEKNYLKSPLVKNAYEFVLECHKSGIKMCVLTSGIRRLAEAALKFYGLYEFFEFVAAADELNVDKSEPESFLMCCEKIGSNPYETLVFEDSLYAIKAAREAGCMVIGMENPQHADELSEIRRQSYKTIRDFKNLDIICQPVQV